MTNSGSPHHHCYIDCFVGSIQYSTYRMRQVPTNIIKQIKKNIIRSCLRFVMLIFNQKLKNTTFIRVPLSMCVFWFLAGKEPQFSKVIIFIEFDGGCSFETPKFEAQFFAATEARLRSAGLCSNRMLELCDVDKYTLKCSDSDTRNRRQVQITVVEVEVWSPSMWERILLCNDFVFKSLQMKTILLSGQKYHHC